MSWIQSSYTYTIWIYTLTNVTSIHSPLAPSRRFDERENPAAGTRMNGLRDDPLPWEATLSTALTGLAINVHPRVLRASLLSARTHTDKHTYGRHRLVCTLKASVYSMDRKRERYAERRETGRGFRCAARSPSLVLSLLRIINPSTVAS